MHHDVLGLVRRDAGVVRELAVEAQAGVGEDVGDLGGGRAHGFGEEELGARGELGGEAGAVAEDEAGVVGRDGDEAGAGPGEVLRADDRYWRTGQASA